MKPPLRVLCCGFFYGSSSKRGKSFTERSFYLAGYGAVRFIIEYFREPDRDLGFVLQFGSSGDTTALFSSFLNFSTGQVLCALMIIGGGLLFFIRKKQTAGLSLEQQEGFQSEETDKKASGGQSKNAIRKKRKRIK